jgi:hypothetical protein
MTVKRTAAPKVPRIKTTPVSDAIFTVRDLQWAFNEWMRRYIAQPDEFMREFQSVQGFQKSKSKPSYGKDCTSYLAKLLKERGEKQAKRASRCSY